jgi:plasmid maintenance system antidote protein VapI
VAVSVETRERVLRLHASGVPSSHIARRLGLPRREVNEIIRGGRAAHGDAAGRGEEDES